MLDAAKAAEVVSLLEPGFVIPIHYGTSSCNIKLAPLNKFLKEMGLGDIESQPSLKVTKSVIPDDTRVIVLEYQH